MAEIQTKFLLDSGDPDEYKEIAALATETGNILWGATTNPSLVAKKLKGKKLSKHEGFKLQKEIVMEILNIVPGAVSAEVYADHTTEKDEMVKQGEDIASWHERVYVKLPTTLEGFKAREALRKAHIPVNNTLVFSQQQIFAICLHEKLCQMAYGPMHNLWPSFISPFVGRLDDRGENGIQLVKNGMELKNDFSDDVWMLEASVRSVSHIKEGINMQTELITAPAAIYKEWFSLNEAERGNLNTNDYQKDLAEIHFWHPSQELSEIQTLDAFYQALLEGNLDITHELTDKGIERFAADWNELFSS